MSYLAALPPPTHFAGFQVHAPILVLPNVFEPELCEQLIGLYDADGGREFGFMQDIAGKTVLVTDHKHKKRRDYTLNDDGLISTVQSRFKRRAFGDSKGAPLQSDTHGTLSSWLLHCRRRSPFSRASRQHNQWDCPSPVRGLDQSEFRLRRWRNKFRRVWRANLSHLQGAQSSFPAHCCTLLLRSLAVGDTRFFHFFMTKPPQPYVRPTIQLWEPASPATKSASRLNRLIGHDYATV